MTIRLIRGYRVKSRKRATPLSSVGESIIRSSILELGKDVVPNKKLTTFPYQLFVELTSRPYDPRSFCAIAVVMGAKRGLDGHTVVAVDVVAEVLLRRMSSMREDAPRPSSLIQNNNDQTVRIKYGTHPNQTLATIPALNQTRSFRKRYLVIWCTKTVNGNVLGISGW